MKLIFLYLYFAVWILLWFIEFKHTLNRSFLLNKNYDRCQDDIDVRCQFWFFSGVSFPSHTWSHLFPPSCLVFSSCCFVPMFVAVWMEVLNTSPSPLKTYPPCGFTRRLVSALPVSPSGPPVITIVTYGSATPSPFTKQVFLSESERQRFLCLRIMCICVRIYVNAHLVGLSVCIIAQLYSW